LESAPEPSNFAKNDNMSKPFNILLQIEDRSGARLNRLYSIQCYLSFPLTNAFHKIHSENYSRRAGQVDIFEFFTQRVIRMEGIQPIDIDCSRYDLKKLEDCRDLLIHCGNENGAMGLIIIEDQHDYIIPLYKVGYLLGPHKLEGEIPFCRWVGPSEFLSHLQQIEKQQCANNANTYNYITGTRNTVFLARIIQ
jgi:hypothetical protein